MPIPKRKVKVCLKKDDVSTVSPEALQKDLNNIGLGCKYTSIENLTKFKSDVLGSWPNSGTASAYGIYKKNKHLYNTDSVKTLDYLTLEEQSPLTAFGFSNDDIHGQWMPSDAAQGYREELFLIQYPEHFDYLLANKPDTFTGVKKSKTETSKDGTVQKIKDLFVQIGTELSSIVVDGLNKTSLEAILVDVIGVNESAFENDYDESNSRVIFLVQNYNEKTEEADAIGVLSIDWRISIKNYKEKKKETKHETKITINVRSAIYTDIPKMLVHYEFVKSHFKNNLFLPDAIPPRPTNIVVYDFLPPACKDTFLHGIPTVNNSDKYVDTIVLYAPNTNLLYALDNTESKAISSYNRSVTSGFTFASSQTLSAELSFEASCAVVKVGFKMGLSVSFTEEWNKSVTEEISISVPENEMAYVYQGYMKSAVLRFSAKDMSYEYLEKAKFLTNILKTTQKPIQ